MIPVSRRVFQVHSSAEQVHGHLRGMILDGRLRGVMPGVLRLEREMGVSRRALMAAIAGLEHEGLLEAHGTGKPRRIVADAVTGAARRRRLRVRMLAYDEDSKRLPLFLEILHRLRLAGHHADFASHTLTGMGMDVGRVSDWLGRNEADAWLVMAGSRAVLEWFATSGVPVFAIFGRHLRQPIAGGGPRYAPTMEKLAERLFGLGHRRIVLMTRSERREPQPGPPERAFLHKLEELGVPIGSYNLPDWSEDADGFQQALISLFQLTPPTVLVLSEPAMFVASMQFLNGRGLAVPGDVSLVCLDDDPAFAWSRPVVSRVVWNPQPLVRAVTRWVGQVAAGGDPRKKVVIRTEFVEGGTVGYKR